MEKENIREEFEIEKVIPVSILEDVKQSRITIPKEIIEDFGIKSTRHNFAWLIEKEKRSDKIIISGRFILK